MTQPDSRADSRGVQEKLARLFSSLFGLGYIPVASGTWGSLAALPFCWYLLHYESVEVYFIFLGVSLLLGALSIAYVSLPKDEPDASWIVIDEWCGQIIACLAAVSLFDFFLAFLFFRIFDIAKPPGVRYFDRSFKHRQGILFDDLVAGLYAWVVLIFVKKSLLWASPYEFYVHLF
jgi:phosphatidylglycerophosphatase A